MTDGVKFMFQPAAQSGSCVNLLCEQNLPWGRCRSHGDGVGAGGGGVGGAARKPIIVLKFDTSDCASLPPYSFIKRGLEIIESRGSRPPDPSPPSLTDGIKGKSGRSGRGRRRVA